MNYDYLNAACLFTLLIVVCITYTLRVLVKGKAHFDRVDRQGGSLLLGKSMLEMAYWSLQPLAKFLVTLSISPNQISWISLVLGGIAGTFLTYGYFGSAALFATLSAFLDTLDGMVARMTGVASDAGEVLDATIDRYVEFFFLAGLVLYYRDIPYIQIIALFALMGSFMVSYSTAKAEALHIPPPPGIMRRPERTFYLILGAAFSALPSSWLGLDRSFDLPVPMAIPMVISMGFIAVLSNISAIERLYTVARERKIQELTESREGESDGNEAEEAGAYPHR